MVASPASQPAPVERTYELSAGAFRALEWAQPVPAHHEPEPCTAVLLHGLSGMADVWADTVSAMGEQRPRCVAIDQRGHGRSPVVEGRYAVEDYLGDLIELVGTLGAPIHLVGHSMGGRVALVAAARHPELFMSVVVVDIGPEAWRRNIERTTALLASRPETFADRHEAMAVARFIVGDRGEVAATRLVDDRLRQMPDGSYEWLASLDALTATVSVQRSRNYWRDWDRISVPALLVRGGDSDELRDSTAARMCHRNPGVSYVELGGVGHNIPMLDPLRLGTVIREFWQ